MRAKKSVVGKYARMTAANLRSETAEFDKEMVVAKSKPLTAEERAWWERVRRRPGRPRRGRGAKVISAAGQVRRAGEEPRHLARLAHRTRAQGRPRRRRATLITAAMARHLGRGAPGGASAGAFRRRHRRRGARCRPSSRRRCQKPSDRAARSARGLSGKGTGSFVRRYGFASLLANAMAGLTPFAARRAFTRAFCLGFRLRR